MFTMVLVASASCCVCICLELRYATDLVNIKEPSWCIYECSSDRVDMIVSDKLCHEDERPNYSTKALATRTDMASYTIPKAVGLGTFEL